MYKRNVDRQTRIAQTSNRIRPGKRSRIPEGIGNDYEKTWGTKTLTRTMLHFSDIAIRSMGLLRRPRAFLTAPRNDGLMVSLGMGVRLRRMLLAPVSWRSSLGAAARVVWCVRRSNPLVRELRRRKISLGWPPYPRLQSQGCCGMLGQLVPRPVFPNYLHTPMLLQREFKSKTIFGHGTFKN